MEVILVLLVIVPILGLFLLPAIIAFSRGHPDRWAILVRNFTPSPTGHNWFSALGWSLRRMPPKSRHPVRKGRGTAKADLPSTDDARKFEALAKYDDDVRAAVETIAPLGDKWVNELAGAYFSLGPKYLPNIVARIKADAAQAAAEEVASEADGISDNAMRQALRRQLEQLSDAGFNGVGVDDLIDKESAHELVRIGLAENFGGWSTSAGRVFISHDGLRALQ